MRHHVCYDNEGLIYSLSECLPTFFAIHNPILLEDDIYILEYGLRHIEVDTVFSDVCLLFDGIQSNL